MANRVSYDEIEEAFEDETPVEDNNLDENYHEFREWQQKQAEDEAEQKWLEEQERDIELDIMADMALADICAVWDD